jgi:hypothetical protein
VVQNRPLLRESAVLPVVLNCVNMVSLNPIIPSRTCLQSPLHVILFNDAIISSLHDLSSSESKTIISCGHDVTEIS